MLYILIGILTVVLDFVTKKLAVAYLAGQESLPLIEGVFQLTYVENRGVAFGLFQDQRWFFVLLSILILILLTWLYYKIKTRSIWMKLGAALVYAGAIGNLIDRVVQGYVVDFLDFCLIGFPVFNVADIAVCVGVVMLAIHYIFYMEKASDNQKSKGAE